MSQATHDMTENIRTASVEVEHVNVGMEEIAEHVRQAASVAGSATQLADVSNHALEELGTAAREIGKVVQTIQDIAEQIHLLALNAAIEAARAGDAGRGFTVVATEVKTLADQAALATDDICARIGRVQSTSHQALGSTSQISSVIKQINEVSTVLATAIGRQNETVRNVAQKIIASSRISDQVAQCAALSAESAGRVQARIETGHESIPAAAAAVEATRASVRQLAHVARELHTLAEPFNTR
jgi:methyl-accepting chemotaxis protein